MPGGWELIVIVLVLVLLFGARKLPELARGTGQALRIFKAETKGLTDDDSDKRDELPPSQSTDASGTDTSSESNPSQADGNGR
ncbi:twin-arginine translocase TatA/TatE family subunit [Nocardioides panacisoli]|nr:twin-arginine translocase TatA/TatE family subunit [Nocardioides panacisoli]